MLSAEMSDADDEHVYSPPQGVIVDDANVDVDEDEVDGADGANGGEEGASTAAEGSQASPSQGVAKKGPKRPYKARKEDNRGCKVTVRARMAMHPGEFFEENGKMMCLICQKEVGHKQSSSALIIRI